MYNFVVAPVVFQPFPPSQTASDLHSFSRLLSVPKMNDSFDQFPICTHAAASLSLNLSCFPPLIDHRPEASRGSLHQLHSKSKHIFPRYTPHVLLACVCIFVSLFICFTKLMIITVSIFFLSVDLAFVSSFFLFVLCLISFCMLSLTALG